MVLIALIIPAIFGTAQIIPRVTANPSNTPLLFLTKSNKDLRSGIPLVVIQVVTFSKVGTSAVPICTSKFLKFAVATAIPPPRVFLKATAAPPARSSTAARIVLRSAPFGIVLPMAIPRSPSPLAIPIVARDSIVPAAVNEICLNLARSAVAAKVCRATSGLRLAAVSVESAP